MTSNRYLIVLGAMILGSVMAGAAAADIDQSLQARVKAYWAAVRDRDWATTYHIEKQDDGRQPLDAYQYYQARGAAPLYLDISVDSIEQEGETATVAVTEQIVLLMGTDPLVIPRSIKTRWKRIGKDWYYVEDIRPQPDLANAKKPPEESVSPAQAAKGGSEAGEGKQLPSADADR